jgi:hypothetical protein
MWTELDRFFGLVPKTWRKRGLLVAREICRVHMQHSEYTMAYKSMLRAMNKLYDPVLMSDTMFLFSFGSLCLEIGRRGEAMKYYEMIRKLGLKSAVKTESNPLIELGNELGTNYSAILTLSEAFINVYDGKFDHAITRFRESLTLHPANVISINNLACCSL